MKSVLLIIALMAFSFGFIWFVWGKSIMNVIGSLIAFLASFNILGFIGVIHAIEEKEKK